MLLSIHWRRNWTLCRIILTSWSLSEKDHGLKEMWSKLHLRFGREGLILLAKKAGVYSEIFSKLLENFRCSLKMPVSRLEVSLKLDRNLKKMLEVLHSL